MQGRKPKMTSAIKSEQRKLATHLLPPIPDKRYFSIGEVGLLCAVKPHVLRYWEQEFPLQLKPAKRRGNRRFYQYEDVMAIRKIRQLLYQDGFTLEGARIQLQENPKETRKPLEKDAVVKKIIADLENVLEFLAT